MASSRWFDCSRQQHQALRGTNQSIMMLVRCSRLRFNHSNYYPRDRTTPSRGGVCFFLSRHARQSREHREGVTSAPFNWVRSPRLPVGQKLQRAQSGKGTYYRRSRAAAKAVPSQHTWPIAPSRIMHRDHWVALYVQIGSPFWLFLFFMERMRNNNPL